jgi:hypothetical protein
VVALTVWRRDTCLVREEMDLNKDNGVHRERTYSGVSNGEGTRDKLESRWDGVGVASKRRYILALLNIKTGHSENKRSINSDKNQCSSPG